MTKTRKKRLLIIPMVFIIFIFLLTFPAVIFAEEEEESIEEEIVEPEPETFDFDVAYSEVSAFGEVGEAFDFQVSVVFDGEGKKYFEIIEEFPPGWSMDINPGTKAIDIALLELKPGAAETLKIKCRPIVDQEPGEYLFKITLKSTVEGDELEGSVEFTGIVKPDGKINLSTLDERLNAEVRPGRDNLFILVLENTGTAPVEDITLNSSGEPEGWQVELGDNIDILDVGQKLEIEVNIIPPDRTIAGDYTIRFNASSEDGNDNIDLRIMVETPLIWKIVGIGLIAFVIAGIAIIFERLGRR
ncbi:MAG: hypothetical protein E3J58_03095 [Actinomycetota bacterium]|nr:MAG: hypothetical protein E3J58_03095 [Actinomycetota bacterium]